MKLVRPNPDRSPGILRTYFLLIAAVAALTVAAALVATAKRPPVYSSVGSVLVRPETRGGAPVLPQMGTEAVVAKSATVAARAADSLDVSADTASSHLTVTVPVDANVVQLQYTAADPEAARNGARAFTQAYVDFRNLDLKRQVAQVISRPELPKAATPPNYPVAGTMALVAGLVLGFAAAFVWDRMRGRLRGPADVQRVTGAEVLASIPARSAVNDPISVTGREKERFGHLVARLSQAMKKKRRVILLVTSLSRGADTTTVAAQTAVALANLGRAVTLVSIDARRPNLHRLLGLSRGPGLTEVLDDQCGLDEVLQYTWVPNLRVLTAGERMDTSQLNMEDLQAVLDRLAKDAVVVIDAPPVLEAPETLLVGYDADLVVMVVDLRSGTRAGAATAAEMLRRDNGKLVGVVTNKPTRSRRIRRDEPEPLDEEPAPVPAAEAAATQDIDMTRIAQDAARNARP
jgi:tyrosine-protein kinase